MIQKIYITFFLEEKEMLSLYFSKIGNKKAEINKISNFEGKELFYEFRIEEKINNITLSKIGE